MKKGIESLKASVIRDCETGGGCFSESGCDQSPRTRFQRCCHAYCDKYKWVIDRAMHYQDKTGVPYENIIRKWEENRNYWYMNYYQDCQQPLLTGDNIIMFEDWKDLLSRKYGEMRNWKFRCPSCGHEQTCGDFEAISVKPEYAYYNCIGRYKDGIGCDWTLGGLLKVNKVTVVKNSQAFPVFEMV